MNAIEALAAALVVVNVALVARRSVWNFPVALAAVAMLFPAEGGKASARVGLPWFVLGFLALGALNSFVRLPPEVAMWARQATTALLLLLGAPAVAFSGPQVAVDRPSAAVGEKVRISGTGWQPGDLVDIETVTPGGRPMRLEKITAIAYDIAVGSVGAYYPEANVLVPLDYIDKESGTPSYKSVPVRVVRSQTI